MSIIDHRSPSSASSPAHALDDLRAEDVVGQYHDRNLAELSDADLVAACTAVVAVPKLAEPDSFVLHAPLEIAARARLLPHVEPAAREAARQRMVWVAATYRAAGDAVAAPAGRDYPDAEAAGRELSAAVHAGDVEGADNAAAFLEHHADGPTLARLTADAIVPSLTAAGHGPILLMHAHALSALSAPGPIGLRGVARQLAARPDWTLGWYHQLDVETGSGGEARRDDLDSLVDFVEPLLRPRSPGALSSNFIYPTMHLTESSGLAAEVLGVPVSGATVPLATRQLGRLAAWSMIQDDPRHAPYGWTHCLTMPQAVLRIASNCAVPRHAIAVAATYALGFRATLGAVRLDPAWAPAPDLAKAAAVDGQTMLDGTPDEAAAAMWSAPAESRSQLVRRLAGRAAVHPDAHLAKYVLACFDAAAVDPDATALFLAAAAFLGGWWREQPATDDPILAP